QPHLELELVVDRHGGLAISGLGFAWNDQCIKPALAHDITSPPVTAIACPVIAEAAGRQRKAAATATSAGVTSRPMGLPRASSARAASSLRPVLVTMVCTARVAWSVS